MGHSPSTELSEPTGVPRGGVTLRGRPPAEGRGAQTQRLHLQVAETFSAPPVIAEMPRGGVGCVREGENGDGMGSVRAWVCGVLFSYLGCCSGRTFQTYEHE